jgi:hypothetical protein
VVLELADDLVFGLLGFKRPWAKSSGRPSRASVPYTNSTT